jgi:hypothetical protein
LRYLVALLVPLRAEIGHFVVVTGNAECSGETRVAIGKLFDVLI